MTTGSIAGKLIKFSVPLIASSVLQLLFNAADVIVVGRFAGDEYLAAVGSTSSLINLLTNLFLGLSIGTNVVAASFFGGRQSAKLQECVHTAVLLSFASGAVLSVAGFFSSELLLRAMMSPPEVLPLATRYLKVYFCGTLAMMVYNFASSLLRAKGDTERPLYILALSGVVNIGLNLFFVIKCQMNVAGVALATVISQTLSAVLVILILVKEKDDFRLRFSRLKPNFHIASRILKIGVPAGFQGIVFSLSNVIIQSSVNTFGPVVIAGNSAGVAVEGFVYTSMNGFSQGALTFVSQNVGAGKLDRVKRVTVAAQLLVFAIGAVLGGSMAAAAPFVLSIFSKNAEVIGAGCERLHIICTFYALCGMMDSMGNCVRGTGHSTLPAVVAMVGSCLLRILWLATVFQIPAFHTTAVIFASYPLSWLVTWAMHTVSFVLVFSNMKKKGVGQALVKEK